MNNQPQKQNSISTSDLILTGDAKKIRILLNGTKKRHQFSYLFGTSGLGKTFVVEDWIRKNENSAYVRIRTGATMSKVRKQVARALFDRPDADTSDIINYFAARPNFVLVIDEATHLMNGCSDVVAAKNLDFLRDIYDEVNDQHVPFGILMVFTDYSLAKLSTCRLGDFLEQFLGRGDNHLQLKDKPSRAFDIEPTVRALVPDADEAIVNTACSIVWNSKGKMRTLHKRIATAMEYSCKKQVPFTAQLLADFQTQYETGDYPNEEKE